MGKSHEISRAEVGLVAVTRVALGIGAGLLLGGKMDDSQRKAAGIALVLIGAVTTIPLAIEIFGKTSRRGDVAHQAG
jgi:hypothetical protein